MRWADSHPVEGTDPKVFIGRPTRRDPKTGNIKASSVFHERFCANGRQVTRTLRTSNKKVAIRRVIERQSNGQAESRPQKSISISEGLDEYLLVCRDRDLSPRTVQKYELVVRGLKASLESQVDAPASTFSEREFWSYNRSMTESGVVRKTRYDRLIVVKQAIKYLKRVGRIETYPLESIRLTKPESAVQPCFTFDQVQSLLDRADDYHRPIFATFAFAGLRFGEVRDLRWSDLLLDRGDTGFIRVCRGGSRDTPKDKESRLIPIHAQLRSLLEELSSSGGRIFHDKDGVRPLSEKKLLLALKRLCEACGFKNALRFKLHSFRHFFCSAAAQNNVPSRYLMAWLGHSDSKIVDMYFKMFDDAAEQAMASIGFRKSLKPEGGLNGESDKRRRRRGGEYPPPNEGDNGSHSFETND